MSVRDLLILVFTFGSVSISFFRPWLGVLALAVFAYMNPHKYAWGVSRYVSGYFYVFLSTFVGMLIRSEDRRPFPWTRETVLFIFLLSYFAFTTFYSPDHPTGAYYQLVKVSKIYLGIFPTFFLIRTKHQLRWLIITITLSFGLLGLKGGVFALSTGFRHRVWGPDNTFYHGNNEIALALNMMLPLIILCSKEVKNKYLKWFFLSVFVFSVFSIISSWSRGGLVALIATLGMMITRAKKRYLLLIIPILLGMFYFALPKLPEKWFGRMETIREYQGDRSAMGRIRAWEYAFNRAREDPFTGGGFETFIWEHGRDVHSAYFEILGEHGFIAFGLWLSLLFGTMVALHRISKRASDSESLDWMKEYAKAIQISLVAYSVGGLFLGVAYWDIFYHLVAMCVPLKLILRNPEPTTTNAIANST